MAQFVSAAAANGALVLAKLRERYHGLTPQGRTAVQAYAALNVLLLALVAFAVFYITPAGLLAYLASFAESLKEMRYGKLLLLALLILTSFPPLFGYGTCVTLCGFAFGVQEGWLLASTGCLIGASLSFVLARTIARSLFAALLARDPIFKGLAAAVRAKGLPLVLLIRLCPFPFPYSNAFFASVETVQFSQFLIATLAITPKLFLHVWVGSRLYSFADPNQREQMDRNTKIANGIYVVGGTALGAFTSWYLYRLTMQYVQEVSLGDEEGDEMENGGLIHDVDTMLDEDDEDDEDQALLHDAASSRHEPVAKRPLPQRSNSSPMLVTPVVTAMRRTATDDSNIGRKSEDGWGGNFSDFDEHEEEETGSLPAPTRSAVHSPVVEDKRRD